MFRSGILPKTNPDAKGRDAKQIGQQYGCINPVHCPMQVHLKPPSFLHTILVRLPRQAQYLNRR